MLNIIITTTIGLSGGVLSASPFFIKKIPNAQSKIDKLVQYQGWIGLVIFCWGIWEIFSSITSTELMNINPMLWIFWTLAGVSDLLVGFLLSSHLIFNRFGNNENIMKKAEKIRKRLQCIQVPLGFVSILINIIYFIIIITF